MAPKFSPCTIYVLDVVEKIRLLNENMILAQSRRTKIYTNNAHDLETRFHSRETVLVIFHLYLDKYSNQIILLIDGSNYFFSLHLTNWLEKQNRIYWQSILGAIFFHRLEFFSRYFELNELRLFSVEFLLKIVAITGYVICYGGVGEGWGRHIFTFWNICSHQVGVKLLSIHCNYFLGLATRISVDENRSTFG